MLLFVITNRMFMICFCTNLKGIHNERDLNAEGVEMFMICFCTNLKGIHNYARQWLLNLVDVYDMLLY